jgi:molybdenum cofactor cytidylyltransferase
MGVNVADDIIDDQKSGVDMQRAVVFAVIERVAGIILAAGGSVRLGEPKQLLIWHDKPFIERVVLIARESGLWPIVVVTGAYRDQIEPTISNLSVQEVVNNDWEIGQSTSIQAGLEALPPDVGAVVFLLVDQPQVTPRLIQNLVEYHASSLAPIVAPQINGQRGNPVLFDRCTFPDLMDLKGDVGGRALFSRYSPSWVNWVDRKILHDVDTIDDYHRLISSDT